MIEFPKDRRGIYLPPQGFLNARYDKAQEAGCLQAEVGEVMYGGLMLATRLNPCAGCPVWDSSGPRCQCFQKYHSEAGLEHDRKLVAAIVPCVKNGAKYEGMSIAEIAAELGVSKSEVKRRKVAGTL